MKQSPKKRLPHGITSALVLGALARLVAKDRWGRGASRAELLCELNLPETTVDDRLRTLCKDGKVMRVGRALYQPKPWPNQAPRQSAQGEPMKYEPMKFVPASSNEEWSKNPSKY